MLACRSIANGPILGVGSCAAAGAIAANSASRSVVMSGSERKSRHCTSADSDRPGCSAPYRFDARAFPYYDACRMERYAALPPLPERINRLAQLAVDLWWSWNADGRSVFRKLDYRLWRETAHNPVRMLWLVTPDRLEAASRDPEFLAAYDSAIANLESARGAHNTWWTTKHPELQGSSIAYFSAEFALHQSLPIYAGGLGVLAGDHCKEASDLGVPLIGIGFMYPQGYFHQHVSAEGWQEESYERLNWADAAIEPATTKEGRACITAVPLGDRSLLV